MIRNRDKFEKNKYRFHKRKGRLIVVGSIEWKWKITQGGDITAWCEDGNIVYTKAWTLLGYTRCDDWYEDCYWNRSTHASVTPKLIEKWLTP